MVIWGGGVVVEVAQEFDAGGGHLVGFVDGEEAGRVCQGVAQVVVADSGVVGRVARQVEGVVEVVAQVVGACLGALQQP